MNEYILRYYWYVNKMIDSLNNIQWKLDNTNLELFDLSYDVASRNEIKPCNMIDKPLVVYKILATLWRP